MNSDKWIVWFLIFLGNGAILFLWLVFGGLQKLLIVGAEWGGVISLLLSMHYMLKEKFVAGLLWLSLALPLIFILTVLIDKIPLFNLHLS